MTAPLVHARASGRPRTKGSLNVYCVRNRQHTVRVEEDIEMSKPWRKAVARALREAQLAAHGKLLQYAGPVEVRLVFFFPMVDGVAGATQFPTHKTMGDVDKLERNVLDALSTPARRDQFPYCSALLADDSQVVDLWGAKFWVSGELTPSVQMLVLPAESAEARIEAARERMGGVWL